MYHCFVRHHDGHGKRPHTGPPGYYPPPGFESKVQANTTPEEEQPVDPEKDQGPAGGWGGPPGHNHGWKRDGRGATHAPPPGEKLPPHIKPSEYSGTFVVVGKKDKPIEEDPSDESFEFGDDDEAQEDQEREAALAQESFEIERDADAPPIKERGPLSGMPNNFTKADFQNARQKTTVEEALKNLAKFGTDVTNLNIEKKLKVKAPFQKACLICCNHYTKPSYVLGSGPINDSATVADNHQQRGFQVFYMVNPTPERFLDLTAFFLQNTKTALTIFFTGHGAQVKDKSGDEDDGFDEAMVFDSGHIVDDDLLVLLEDTCPKNLRVLLLTDCCHSGSIWDLQSEKDKSKLPENVISVSAAKDSQTAKQTNLNQKDQGIFTYFFWKILNSKPQITPKQIESVINRAMTKFNQHYTYSPSRPAIADKPFFS